MYGAGLPEMPRVSSTFPCSVHWRTVWSPSSARPLRPREGAGGAGKPSFAERAEEFAGGVKHDLRGLPAIENVDVVVLVHAAPADFLERPARWQFRAIADDSARKLFVRYQGCH